MEKFCKFSSIFSLHIVVNRCMFVGLGRHAIRAARQNHIYHRNGVQYVNRRKGCERTSDTDKLDMDGLAPTVTVAGPATFHA